MKPYQQLHGTIATVSRHEGALAAVVVLLEITVFLAHEKAMKSWVKCQ